METPKVVFTPAESPPVQRARLEPSFDQPAPVAPRVARIPEPEKPAHPPAPIARPEFALLGDLNDLMQSRRRTPDRRSAPQLAPIEVAAPLIAPRPSAPLTFSLLSDVNDALREASPSTNRTPNPAPMAVEPKPAKAKTPRKRPTRIA
jgi:hypothetical protein